VIGGICLLLALYAFQILPVNYAGLALMVLGFALIAVELFVPSFGILGIGGVLAVVFGSIILMDTDVPGMAINPGLIAGMGLASALAFFAVIYLAARSHRNPRVSGTESLIGRERPNQSPTSPAVTAGCISKARTGPPARSAGSARRPVEIVAIDGLTLIRSAVPSQTKESKLMNIDLLYFMTTILVVLVLLIANTIKILREYERGVIFTLGRFYKVKGPGLIIVIPFIQQMVRVDLRTIVLDVPTQDVISRDNVSVKVNAVIYYKVVDPQKAIINVERFMDATSQLAQTTLRSVLGKHELDEMLAERDKLNEDIQVILDRQTDGWGVKVSNVEIKHVDLDESMIRAIARQAEAERTRRSKVILADGEQQAAKKLVEAATELAEAPVRCSCAICRL
jgi:regulator of protease activity HflC (stomatin/prohibitin superfamily)/membrane protein implicated in regulation of membrane protease activity